MNFAVIYLAHRCCYRLIEFFHHWYVDASRKFAHLFISTLERLDRTFAVRITLRYFFHPLYKDYTIIGRILGVIFRSIRVVIGVTIYAFWALIFLVCYLLWLAVPPAILWHAISTS